MQWDVLSKHSPLSKRHSFLFIINVKPTVPAHSWPLLRCCTLFKGSEGQTEIRTKSCSRSKVSRLSLSLGDCLGRHNLWLHYSFPSSACPSMCRIRKKLIPLEAQKRRSSATPFWIVHSSTVQWRWYQRALVSLTQEQVLSCCASSFAPIIHSLNSYENQIQWLWRAPPLLCPQEAEERTWNHMQERQIFLPFT